MERLTSHEIAAQLTMSSDADIDEINNHMNNMEVDDSGEVAWPKRVYNVELTTVDPFDMDFLEFLNEYDIDAFKVPGHLNWLYSGSKDSLETLIATWWSHTASLDMISVVE